ncbi:unnamed protein product [Brassica rapa]|uniref:Uncharacterized protein n=2 Tax=Brassica TaxID=3705 RepID=A0A8D9MF49_BRACM|nr:unnamed protein product [Brassica napus]CAG7909997.1 unnamed protein product [Brassica rapa]
MDATMEIYKTRKMVQASEVKADQLGLERSEQLRKLYLTANTITENVLFRVAFFSLLRVLRFSQ